MELELFNTDKTMPEAIKTYRRAVIKNIKTQIGRILDEKLADLDKSRVRHLLGVIFTN